VNLSATRPTERGVVRAGAVWQTRLWLKPLPERGAPEPGTVLPDYVGTRTDRGFLGGALLGLEPRSTKFMVQSSELLCLLTAHHLLRSNHAPHFSLITNSRQPHRKSRLIPLQRQRFRPPESRLQAESRKRETQKTSNSGTQRTWRRGTQDVKAWQAGKFVPTVFLLDCTPCVRQIF
jgi:hypothetical protein